MNLNTLQGFRQEVYGCFDRAADALFNSVDALLTETQAHSFPELSLSPVFERRWGSLYEAFEDGQIDQNRLRHWQQVARSAGIPLLATNDVLYHTAGRRELHDVITCIREHVTLAEAGHRLEANAERHLKSADEMTALFHEAPEATAETMRL